MTIKAASLFTSSSFHSDRETNKLSACIYCDCFSYEVYLWAGLKLRHIESCFLVADTTSCLTLMTVKLLILLEAFCYANSLKKFKWETDKQPAGE